MDVFKSARCKSSAPTDILISIIEIVREAAIMTRLSENIIWAARIHPKKSNAIESVQQSKLPVPIVCMSRIKLTRFLKFSISPR